MKKILPVLSVLFLTLASGFAQNNIYYSRDAKLQIIGSYQKELMIAKTMALNIVLDYETAEILLRFPLSSLNTNVDTINEILKFNSTEVIFKGKLGMDYINTQIQRPQTFKVEGLLTIKGSRTAIDGNGELHHVDDVGEVSCLLGLVFPLDMKALNIDLDLADLEGEFEVIITQAVLHVDKN
ncbi:MAG: hypothetical protein HKN68_08180 [Saprospiraceae bacterium]|nr:hypothetical protein [Saprospiraceae bacterium]